MPTLYENFQKNSNPCFLTEWIFSFIFACILFFIIKLYLKQQKEGNVEYNVIWEGGGVRVNMLFISINILFLPLSLEKGEVCLYTYYFFL